MKELLFNNEVGVLIFVPWVVMVPFLWRRFWSRSRNEAVLVLGMVLINYLFFAKYVAWHGGWSVGPRMLNAVFPFLILPVAMLFDKGAESLRSWAGRMTVALISLACLIQMLLMPYPGSRYYTMEVYNQQHSMTQWWSGKPLLEAAAALPELLLGKGDQSNNPAHQYLLTFPNPVNQIRADLWLLKAPLLGVPHFVAYFLTALLLILFVLGMRAVLAQLSRRAKLHGERPAQDLDPTQAAGV
jgi:NADH:ubiquinone oxidoreductase subunit 6 (subunit J)